MAKNSNYLTHDLGARNDPKLVRLQMEMGGIGLAIYWIIIEMIWEGDGFLPMDFSMIAYSIRWARSEDVESVVTKYDLFQNDGNRFWSRSALERINHKKEVSESRARAGIKGARATNGRRAEESSFAEQKVVSGSAIVGEGAVKPTADAERFNGICSAIVEQMTGKSSTNNKIKQNNEEINKRNFSVPLTERDRQRIIEIFFFNKNLLYPEREMSRFVAHYEGRGWVYGDGTAIKVLDSAAEAWKTESGEATQSRFDVQFLNWYQLIYATVGDNHDLQQRLLSDLNKVIRDNKTLTIEYKSMEVARNVATLVQENDLFNGWDVRWKALPPK